MATPPEDIGQRLALAAEDLRDLNAPTDEALAVVRLRIRLGINAYGDVLAAALAGVWEQWAAIVVEPI